MLLRRALHAKVLSVDTSTADQVWLRLAGMRNVLFGFVYVPPFDSPYFSPALFGAVQERIKTAEMTTKFVILGDMNTRFGEYVRDLPRSADVQNAHFYTYPHIPDAVHNPNEDPRYPMYRCQTAYCEQPYDTHTVLSQQIDLQESLEVEIRA